MLFDYHSRSGRNRPEIVTATGQKTKRLRMDAKELPVENSDETPPLDLDPEKLVPLLMPVMAGWERVISVRPDPPDDLPPPTTWTGPHGVVALCPPFAK